MLLLTGKRIRSALLAGLLAVAQSASAHDLAKMEHDISESEPYAQLVEKPAPDFDLQSADGQAVSLEDFGGQSVVLYFVYARCREECPLHSLKIKQVQEQAADAGLEDQIQFVAIATDTEDAGSTAELMRQHPKQYGLDSTNWIFLFGGSGRERAGLELARSYALEFTPVAEGVQAHGIVTHLIDPQGRMRARYHGLNFDSISLVSYAAAVLHGDHGAAANSQFNLATNPLTPMDWVLSVLGVLCLGLLSWAAWTWLIPRGSRRKNAAASDP